MDYLSHFTRYINCARRVAYEEGAYISYKACKEIEKHGDISILEDLFETRKFEDKRLEAKYPNVALLKYWYREWSNCKNEVFREGNIRNFDIGVLNLYFIEHPWDIGGYVAGIKSGSKPAICVNYGAPFKDWALLNGRAGKSPVNLNILIRTVEAISEGKIKGGGHPVAIGGCVQRDLSKKEVLLYFVEAVEYLKKEQQLTVT